MMEMNRGSSGQIVDLTNDNDLIPSIEHDAPDRVGPGLLYWRRDQAAAPPLGNSTTHSPSQTPPQPPYQTSPYFFPTTNKAALIPTHTPAQPGIIKQPLDLKFIVKLIDPSLALHRTAYDPKTIARDVLLAADLHPQRRGLNFHMSVLKEHYVQVNEYSDLETFRWDLVDPGGPSLPYINMPPTFGLGSMSTSDRTSGYVKSPANQSTPSLLQRRSVDPTSNRPSILRNSALPAAGSPLQIVLPSFTPAQREEYQPMISPDPDDCDELSLPTPQSRPGGFSALKPNYPHLVSPSVNAPITTSKRRGRPFGKRSILSGASTTGTSTPTSVSDTIKKRGRPFRNSHGPAEPTSKKRGRLKVLQRDIAIPDSKFIPFLCEWKDCPAELQNLETLRTHVFNVHGKIHQSSSIPCLWDKCGNKHTDDESLKTAADSTKYLVFDSKEKWQYHISKAHLIPIAWHLGDGPRGSSMEIPSTSLSPASQPWLYDSEGRQVTPSVQNQRMEGGRARDNNARRFAKEQKFYVLVPAVKNPEEYVKVQMDDDEDVDELL